MSVHVECSSCDWTHGFLLHVIFIRLGHFWRERSMGRNHLQ